jgi:O-acetylhomoserine (thiol)-lyase
VFEKRVAALEGGAAALGFASGSSAITFALLNIAGAGDHIVSANSLYGGTYNLFVHTLPRFGVEVDLVDPTDPESFRAAIKPTTKALYAETVGNPKLDTLDIAKVAAIAHDAGVPLIVDNTMPTPYLVQPLRHGADIVVHSATKFIGGHGTSIGGVVVDGGSFDWSQNDKFPGLTEPDASYHGLRFYEALGPVTYIVKLRVSLLRDIGAALSPFNAFLFLQGLETLPLRMERHSTNALAVAEHLEAHDRVAWVSYPGLCSHRSCEVANRYHYRGLFGAIVGFGVKGGRESGRRFVENTELFSHLANIGDAKSLCIHPATTTHSQLTADEQLETGVSDDFVRLSIGLESIEDIIADIDQALATT